MPYFTAIGFEGKKISSTIISISLGVTEIPWCTPYWRTFCLGSLFSGGSTFPWHLHAFTIIRNFLSANVQHNPFRERFWYFYQTVIDWFGHCHSSPEIKSVLTLYISKVYLSARMIHLGWGKKMWIPSMAGQSSFHNRYHSAMCKVTRAETIRPISYLLVCSNYLFPVLTSSNSYIESVYIITDFKRFLIYFRIKAIAWTK